MATTVRGSHDAYVERVGAALDEYERAHPGAVATVYRQSKASIRIRVVDERFAKMSKGDRHDLLWDFVAARVGDDDVLQEIAVLLPLAPAEQARSFMNGEFDEPAKDDG